MLGYNTNGPRRARIVELVGLAGAGKTTLAGVLGQRDENVRLAADLAVSRLAHAPVFFANLVPLLPIILRRSPASRGFTWEEIKAIVYLKAWPARLRRAAARNGTVILLDHGALFKLATLNAFGPEKLKDERFEGWWQDMFTKWAGLLDMVIWLDAPDSELVERINRREQRHAVKGSSEQAAVAFLARYRQSYEQILAGLSAHQGPTVLSFDTSRHSMEQIADQLLSDS